MLLASYFCDGAIASSKAYTGLSASHRGSCKETYRLKTCQFRLVVNMQGRAVQIEGATKDKRCKTITIQATTHSSSMWDGHSVTTKAHMQVITRETINTEFRRKAKSNEHYSKKFESSYMPPRISPSTIVDDQDRILHQYRRGGYSKYAATFNTFQPRWLPSI